MAHDNATGVVSNTQDALAGLTQALEQRFSDGRVEVVGCAALFSARR